MQRKELDRARELVLDAIQHQQLAQQLNPDSRVSKAFLCKHYFLLYQTDQKTGDLKAAEQTLKKSLEVAEEMARDFPDVAEGRYLLAEACRRMGWLLASNPERIAEAEQMLRRAVDVSESLAADFPQTREHAYEVAASLNLLGAHLPRQQKYDESLEVYQRAVAKLETLIGSGGSAPRYWVLLGTIHNDASMMLMQRQLWSDADRMLERAVKGLEHLPPASRATPFCDHLLGALFNNLAISRSEMGQPKEACDFARQAIAYQHAALDRCTDAARAEYRRHLSNHHYILAACLLEAAEFSEVISHYRKSLEFGDWEGYRYNLVAGLLAASSRPDLQDLELAVTLRAEGRRERTNQPRVLADPGSGLLSRRRLADGANRSNNPSPTARPTLTPAPFWHSSITAKVNCWPGRNSGMKRSHITARRRNLNRTLRQHTICWAMCWRNWTCRRVDRGLDEGDRIGSAAE